MLGGQERGIQERREAGKQAIWRLPCSGWREGAGQDTAGTAGREEHPSRGGEGGTDSSGSSRIR